MIDGCSDTANILLLLTENDNFDWTLLCNKQFSIPKILGFGLGKSRDSGLGNGRLQCQPATVFLYWHKHKTHRTYMYLLYNRRSNVKNCRHITHTLITLYAIQVIGLQNRLVNPCALIYWVGQKYCTIAVFWRNFVFQKLCCWMTSFKN